MQVQVALVLGMNGHGRIAEHGLRPCRCDGQKLARFVAAIIKDRVFDLPDVALLLLVDHFEIADGGLAARAPVDHVTSAIDQAFAIQAQERFEDGTVKRRVEGEFFARPIAGSAQANHLAFDRAAAFGFPFPYALFKFVAAERSAVDAFLGEHAFDDKLRGDACVIHSG